MESKHIFHFAKSEKVFIRVSQTAIKYFIRHTNNKRKGRIINSASEKMFHRANDKIPFVRQTKGKVFLADTHPRCRILLFEGRWENILLSINDKNLNKKI
jgi:hypothetical protein